LNPKPETRNPKPFMQSGIDYASVLNPAQYEAVTTIEGPALVIAGAGSGKTRTLVYRLAYLVEQGILPESILLLTFTRKAATEMLTRASELLDGRCRLVAGGTFHSTGNLILRRYGDRIGYPNGFQIMDQGDSTDAVGLLIGRLGFKGGGQRFPKKATVHAIFSKIVNRSLDLETILEDDYVQFLEFADQLAQLHAAYELYKREQRLMDYDDLLLHWWRLLAEHPGIRKRLAENYQYIMVDEYQDTNKLQAEIVRLLAGERSNVMVVGDDSQSIYSFRGANFQNIMDFPKLFPDAQIIKLEQNYRSTQPILDFTNGLITQAREHYTKCLFSERISPILPAAVATRSDKEQSLFVIRTIQQLQARGIDLSEMAVLFRASFHSYDLEVELARAGIPYAKYGGLRFAESAHLKDVVAHLRVVVNPWDSVSWHRLLTLVDGIGPRTADRVIQVISRHADPGTGLREYLSDTKKTAHTSGLERLAVLLEEFTRPDRTVAEMVQAVRSYYEPIAVKLFDDYPKRLKDLEFLESWAEQYDSLAAMITDLTLEPPDFHGIGGQRLQSGILTLSTIHSAKGLEWRAVFILSAAEGRFPSSYAAYRDADLEEERRLFYVAATRAKDYLLISYPMSFGSSWSGDHAGGPSPFLHDISTKHLKRLQAETFQLDQLEAVDGAPKRKARGVEKCQELSWQVGQRIQHATFGLGVILAIADQHLVVAFENFGKKILDRRHAPLLIAGD
jgi:DNA helicase-2/ATP-dependent DNA helicase PcrA